MLFYFHIPWQLIKKTLAFYTIENAGFKQKLNNFDTDTILTVQSISENFEKKYFLCCYKGILINYRYIKVINDYTIILNKSEQLSLSRRKLKDVNARYLELTQDW